MAHMATGVALLGACTSSPIDIAGLAPNTLRDGVVAHWPLDDGAGTVALDRSRHGHDGAVIGGTWIPGHFGGALHFELGSEITVPAFPQATSTWSVALWVRPPMEDFGASFVTLLSTEVLYVRDVRPGGGWEVNLRMNPSAGIVSYYQFGYWLGPNVGDYDAFDCQCVVPQQWTHLAAVVDGVAGTLSFYANGVYQGNGVYAAGSPVNQPIKPGTASLYIGRWDTSGTRRFKGDLDDIVIYDRTLTADEVTQLARDGAPDPL